MRAFGTVLRQLSEVWSESSYKRRFNIKPGGKVLRKIVELGIVDAKRS